MLKSPLCGAILDEMTLRPCAEDRKDSIMEPTLFTAHFQLTGRCNLACRFCGQTKGMLAAEERELPVETWRNVADSLEKSARAAGVTPEVMLWGGEPLLYRGFAELAELLSRRGFRVGMVTNGTLINRFAPVLREFLDVIHVSVDGMEEAHDRVRGRGVFARMRRNLELLRGRRGKLIFLTTVSDANVAGLAELPFQLAELGPDRIILQQLMYLSQAEIQAYRDFSRRTFGCDYPELEAWHREEDAGYLARLKEELAKIRKTDYPVPVEFTGHVYPRLNDEAPPCEAPFCRVHIRHDGAVGFCTDYFGFSAGNITERPLEEIFRGERAELFRAAVRENALPTCRHCPWRLQHGFRMLP